MKARLLRIGRWAAYPLFYLLCLAIFAYWTFPFSQLKGRIIAEFDRMQQQQKRRPGEQPMRLEIDDLDGYWLSGVEVTGARLIIPPKPSRRGPMPGMGAAGSGSGSDAAKEEPPKASELLIDRATARVRLLPLLIGDVLIDFEAEAFGGALEGTLPVGAEAGDVDVSFEALELGSIAPIAALLEGVPVSGLASGEVHLSPKEGKFSKADGRLSIHVDGVKLGSMLKNDETGQLEDVVEIQGIRVPAIQVGSLIIEGVAVDGTLTLDQFVARGRDFELIGEGKIKLAEQWEQAQADISVKFKFSDAYRTSSGAATSLLGKPGDTIPPLVEMGPSPLRTAKTDDGYYRFTVAGKLGNVEPKPAGTKGTASSRRSSARPNRPTKPRLNPSPNALKRPVVAPRDEEREEREEREPPPRPEEPAPEPPRVREEPTPEPPPDEEPSPEEPGESEEAEVPPDGSEPSGDGGGG